MSSDNFSGKSPFQKTFSMDRISSTLLAKMIGLFFVLAAAIFVAFIGSWRSDYAKQFYYVKFQINFLEGINPGMKIRYQGGPVVGEILGIESDYHQHYLSGRLKKDFLISKRGSRVTLRQAGVFGQDYIDVSTFPVTFYDKFYEDGDIIPLETITPGSVEIINLAKMLESDENHLNPLGRKLTEIKDMVLQLRENKYFVSREARKSILEAVNKTRETMNTMLDYSASAYETVLEMDHTLSSVSENLKQNIPVMSRRIYGAKNYLSYRNSPEFSQYFHDEFLYSTIIMQLKVINRKLENYKAQPYRLIYN